MKRFFTLVELLAVIAILAILMAIGVGVFSSANRKMAESRTEAVMKIIEVAFDRYFSEVGFYPPGGTVATLGDLVIDEDNAALIKHFPEWETMKKRDATRVGNTSEYRINDAFGSPLRYRYPGRINEGKFDLGSLGANGRYGEDSPGGEASTVTIEDTIYDHFGRGDDITNFKR